MAIYKLNHWIIICAVLSLFAIGIWQIHKNYAEEPIHVVTLMRMQSFGSALQDYYNENHMLPPKGEVVAALLGNERKKKYIQSRSDTFQGGQLLDQWEMPIAIDYETTSTIRFLSSGKDKKFDNTDDISYKIEMIEK